MTNKEKYDKAFREAFGLGETEELSSLKYQSIPNWDSVGHMGLIACIEETFDIMFDTDDMIDFSSYEYGIELLKKYEVVI